MGFSRLFTVAILMLITVLKGPLVSKAWGMNRGVFSMQSIWRSLHCPLLGLVRYITQSVPFLALAKKFERFFLENQL
ncbi:MAG: hypothetical protein MK230_07895, partial [Candidatus Marinimicrobia bacterium]|nr:hypothetical protein [Candidatus Neomarinimicrobiota bacterium]